MSKIFWAAFAILIVSIGFQISYAAEGGKDLIGLWLFDEDKGDIAKDSSPNGNDGEIVDCEWVEGKFGSALDFNGTSSYVEVPHSKSLSISDDQISITAWITQRLEGDEWRTIFSKGLMEGINENWALFTNVKSEYLCPVFSLKGGERWWHIFVEGSLPADEEWHHVATTYDGSAVNVYIDGKLIESVKAKGNLVPNENALRIGWRKNSPHVWNGALDEIGVFHRVLTEEEIKNIMQNGYMKYLAVESPGKLATVWGELKKEQ